MLAFIENLSPYILPPLLSLIVGITLAVISLVKGKFERDNILFSMVCIWYVLISPVFISHHLIQDEKIILSIDRWTHFVYVFIPAINIIFFHRLVNIQRRKMEIAYLVLSTALSLSTFTDYYFYGLYKFSWGYIAKGGIIFQIFGAYSFLSLIYVSIITIKRLRSERNEVMRMKIKYIVLSLLLMAALTTCNIPAINGIDFYPFGNFIFIPLAIMAYGVLRYRLLDIRSILHLTLMWLVLSSLIALPNGIIFVLLRPYLGHMDSVLLFLTLTVWFFLNYLYMRRIQPMIDQVFNKRKFNLRKYEAEFIDEISLLKNLGELIREFREILKKTLNLQFVEYYQRKGEDLEYSNGEKTLVVDEDIQDWFLGANHLAEKNMVETNPYYAQIREKLLGLFEHTESNYIVPLVQNDGLMGMLIMGEKTNLKQIMPDEIRFINNVRSAAAISLSNSLMYQNLSNLKDNLEMIVEERTRELKKKNDQMLFELKVAKNVQKTMLPTNLPNNENIQIASRIIPLMEVSGDFYDIIQIGSERIAIALVDVSGHGVPSALLTSMIKSEIDNQLKTERDTALICSNLNLNLQNTLSETGFYFTMFLCILNIGSMEMEYSNCGHTDPIIIKANGEIVRLSTDGFFIGTPFEAAYESRKIKMDEGDRIYFFTDGVTEARDNEGQFYGEERLIDAIKETLDLTVEKQLKAMIEKLERFQENNADGGKDDITLMIAEIGKPLSLSKRIKEVVKLYKDKEYRKAIEKLQQVDETSLSSLHLYLLAKLYSSVDNMERTLYYVDRALEREPGNREYLYFRGRMLFRCGRIEEARDTFKSLMALDPEYKRVRLFMDKIDAQLT